MFRVMADCSVDLPPAAGLRVGVPRTPFFDDLDDGVGERVEGAIAFLTGVTAGMKDVSLPATDHISMAGETYAYHQPYFDADSDLFTPHARRAIRKDAEAKLPDYIRARWQLDELRRDIHRAFEDVNVVVLPTRRKLPETIVEYLKRDALDAPVVENTGPFNLYGIPAITIPCGFTRQGLPVGLTIAGPSESAVLALAQAYEQAHGWHQMLPPLR
jgi:aspartyl-tRNA(Asn)/glutamyl-tRNA(Gln) amidotransferase subunit A